MQRANIEKRLTDEHSIKTRKIHDSADARDESILSYGADNRCTTHVLHTLKAYDNFGQWVLDSGSRDVFFHEK